MNKLYVYGCSFSEPFQIESGGPEFDSLGFRNLKGYDYWGTHLASKLNLECRTKSFSGIGWNYISNRIDEDILTWTKDDIIVISPSFFSRVTFEELIKHDSQSDLAHLMHDWEIIYKLNERRWRQKIKTLQHHGYRIYTWLVEFSPNAAELKNVITAHSYVNWKDWMDQHKEYWQDPTTNKYPGGDWHFNEQGHIAVAEIMYEYICQK